MGMQYKRQTVKQLHCDCFKIFGSQYSCHLEANTRTESQRVSMNSPPLMLLKSLPVQLDFMS